MDQAVTIRKGLKHWLHSVLLLVAILLAACQNSGGTAVSSEANSPPDLVPAMTATLAAPIVATTVMPTATATPTATPSPPPAPTAAVPPPLTAEKRYDPESLAIFTEYIRREFVQPAIDVPVREAIMAAEELNFILIPIPNEFQQQVSFVPHPAGEMRAVFVPESTDSLMALLEDPSWFAALSSGYFSLSGKSLGWFELKEIAVGDATVIYLVYRAEPEPDRFSFAMADLLHATGGFRGLYFAGPIE